MEFYKISTRRKQNGVVEIYPVFIMGKKSDLMIKGGDFYAVWIEERKLWSTDQDDVIRMVDRDMEKYAKEHEAEFFNGYSIRYMRYSDQGSIDQWIKYVKKQQRDNFVQLDARLIFSNQETTKESYATKKLPYALAEGSIENYEKLIGTLYSPDEKAKLEWAIGAVVAGDSINIQKFIVLYGDRGTGKSTFLDIVKKLFQGYWTSFEAKALGSVNNAFALEAFKDNPLVAIDPEAKLDRIEDNTKINSLTAHEAMFVNAKYEKMYSTRFNSFLFMGTNSPVKITDAKSGILRRLIDVNPTGNKVPKTEYKRLVKNINYELGAIAKHCLDVYEAEPDKYDDYIPTNMLAYTNDFYNFVIYIAHEIKVHDGISLQEAWHLYDGYCQDTNTRKEYMRIFREELKNYFGEFLPVFTLDDGTRVRSYYKGFRLDKFDTKIEDYEPDNDDIYEIDFKEQKSLIDELLKDCPAQEAFFDENGSDRPKTKWANCKTKLKDIDTSKLHYILPKGHENLIRIDFDYKDKDGNKDLSKNLKEASKWPKTYAEISKSGGGIHLYYIYTGDPSKLSKIYSPEVEIKTNGGLSAIRRKLTKCNDIPIAKISSGLPLKGDDKVVSEKTVMNDKQLRTFIKRALNKEHHGATKPEIDFIFKVLEDKYNSGEPYDVSDMRNAVLAFAASSTHQSDKAIKVVSKMHFKSDDAPLNEEPEVYVEHERPLSMFDIEVWPNLFLIVWSKYDSDDYNKLFNPSPETVQELFRLYRQVGFNNRRYDNHVCYGRILGRSNEGLYNISQAIINNKSGAFFGEAYNLSYTDIYDYASKKQSLKKWEIELGIHHQEFNFPWDQPIPEELWGKAADYCVNDVKATKATWDATQSDFLAREILADLTGMTVNDTTNTLTARLIFGKDKNPQSKFNYRDLSQPVLYDEDGNPYPEEDLIFRAWNGEKSAKPFFPGYTFDKGVSTYRGEEIGEGGKVYAEPGIYYDVPVLDITSMHPHSIIAERLFGPYTDIFEELVQARVCIKHAIACHKNNDQDGYLKHLEFVRTLPHLGEKLSKYLKDYEKLKNLPQALKIAINSVYGLTAANFSNPFRDPRNKDNIVAKRGALFMTDLKYAVQERGFTVAHIKTDSIKIPGATPEIRKFVEDFGHMYGYSFEVEDEYEKMCLVNDAVYIAKEKNGGWTATGTQFQIPYVFKKLFSKEPIEFDDMCETKSVTSSLYLDFDDGFEDDEHTFYLDFNDGRSDDEHNYAFVGKIGRFCPVKEGCGGGILYREKNGKYSAATGTKGYRWKEAEVVRILGKTNEIDTSYYEKLCDEAIEAINEAGSKIGVSYDYFVNGPSTPPVYSYKPIDDPYASDSDIDLPF